MASPCLLLAFGIIAFENMNGDYLITKTPNAPEGTFNTKWSDYPNGVEFFEVHMGPMTTLYSQVWWKLLPSVPLPADLVKRFNGKGMAIVGYETDSVRKTPEGDVSVPINVAYNHHHDVYLTGRHSKMAKVPYDPLDLRIPLMARHHPEHLDMPVETSSSPLNLPTSLHLADGNGGEYRKSYHGFPPPVAYVIDSPQSVHVNPMFIDTFNRDQMNVSGGSPFVAGPLPKRHNLAPQGAPYSGLLECPLTDRIRKMFPAEVTPTSFQCNGRKQQTSCQHQIDSADRCFSAAQAAVGEAALETAQGPSDTHASGCTLAFNGRGKAAAFFNTQQTQQCCGAGVTFLTGSVSSLVDLNMAVASGSVQISLTGPDGAWFGVGFFAQAMEERPYAIIVDGQGGVSERMLASHMGSAANPAGDLLTASVTVTSTNVVDGRRTVVLSRSAIGISPRHANFTLRDLQIPFISALGSTPALSYHRHKTASSLSLWPSAAQPICLCQHPPAPFGSAHGTIQYLPTGEQFGFINACRPEPRESVLASHNPTCDVRAYTGGLQVCKHKWSLLDMDQGQPWADQPLVYYQKYRFYFQEYDPKVHVITLPRTVWEIGAFIGEYDVPQCKVGTPVEDCRHEVWGVITPVYDHDFYIAAAHFHCHAPTCLAMELWNNKTGELLCRQRPVYGGTGKVDLAKFDEPGYILQPPCLWGDAPGLAPMPLASNVTFTVKAITNNTYGHHGEMAFPEINLVPWNRATGKAQPGKSNTPLTNTNTTNSNNKVEWKVHDVGGGLRGSWRTQMGGA